jgi:hypothetical protein
LTWRAALGASRLRSKFSSVFFQWQLRVPQQACDPVFTPFLAFPFREIQQILFIAQRLPFCLPRFFFKACANGRQMQLAEIFREVRLHIT